MLLVNASIRNFLLAMVALARRRGSSQPASVFAYAVLTLSLLAIAAAPARAEACLEADDLRPWVASYCPGGATYSLVAVGGFAYLNVDGAVRVLDVADPAHPTEVGTMTLPTGLAQVIHGQDGWVWIATIEPFGVATLRQQADGMLEFLSWFALPTQVRDVAAYQNALYVAENHDGVHVYDVTDPVHPLERGHLFADDSVYLNDPVPGLLYCGRSGNGSSSLVVLDLADPFAPQVASETGPQNPMDFLVTGGLGLALTWGGTAVSYDVTDPAHPILLDTVNAATAGYAYGILLDRGVLLVKSYTFMRAIAFDDPANLRVAWAVDHIPRGYEMAPVGDQVYFQSIDDCWYIRDPGVPYTAEVARLALGLTSGMILRDDLLYLGGAALTIIDGANPDAPVVLSQLTLPTDAGKIILNGDAAYVLGGTAGFHVVDISDPRHPAYVASYDPSWAYSCDDFALGSHYLSLVGTNNVLTVYDVANPFAPMHRFHSGVASSSYRIAAKNDCVYYLTSDAGVCLKAYRIPASGSPVFLTRLDDLPGSDLCVVDDFLFTGNVELLGLVDVSTPDQPVVIGRYPVPAASLLYDGVYLYARDGARDFHVVDFRQPTSPVDLGVLQISGDSGSLVSCRGRLLMKQGIDLVTMLAMCDAPVATYLQDFSATVVGSDVLATWTVSDDASATSFALVGRSPGGSIEIPCEKVGRGSYRGRYAPTEPGAIELDLYLVTGDRRELIAQQTIRVDAIRRTPIVLDVRPNPFNPRADVTFSFASREHATIAVFDLAGRRLAVLAEGEFSPGPHRLTWHGDDADGQALAAGIYVVRCESGSGVASQKVAIVR